MRQAMVAGSGGYNLHNQLSAQRKAAAQLDHCQLTAPAGVHQLTDQDLQEIINVAYAAGRSRKVLKLLAADLRAFCKYCRKAKLSAYVPEELKIPAGVRYKGRTPAAAEVCSEF